MDATISVICYKSKTLANGEHPLMLRIAHCRCFFVFRHIAASGGLIEQIKPAIKPRIKPDSYGRYNFSDLLQK